MTLQYAVIGNQINYSKSPIMHNNHFKHLIIDARYTIFNIDTIAKEIDNLRQYNGFNVTVPYKELIIPHLDKISNEAKQINAVNTVHVKDGKLIGYNTDLFGFYKLLEHNINLQKSYNALIIGAGGASRAVYHVLKHELHAQVTIANRSKERAVAVAPNENVISLEVAEHTLASYDLVINATPVGVKRYESVINIKKIAKNAVFIDLNYQHDLKFLNDAKRLGASTINGKDMLVYQAAKAFQIWFEQEPNVSLMYQALNEQ